MKTTLNEIWKHNPRSYVWRDLLSYLGKTKADDEPLSITTILDSNGLDDALWCLRAVEGHDKEIRLYAVWCARQVQHLMTDQRSLDALDVAERYANGEATDDELTAARNAAEAVWRAAGSVWAARVAWGAAWAAAGDAVWRSAGDAASAAAWVAAWAAAGDAEIVGAEEMRQRQADELRRICKGD